MAPAQPNCRLRTHVVTAGELNKEHGWHVGIHVDAASGGFLAPFIYPDLVWDFRLPNVVSINTSGHKCALPHIEQYQAGLDGQLASCHGLVLM